MTALRPLSTKRVKPVPPGFRDAFIRGGWAKVNAMFGKRAAARYFALCGSELAQARREWRAVK